MPVSSRLGWFALQARMEEDRIRVEGGREQGRRHLLRLALRVWMGLQENRCGLDLP